MPPDHKLYTFNGKSVDVSVIDAPTLQPVATIEIGGKPEFAVSDHAGRIFVNIEDTAEIAVIAVRSDTLIARWPLTGCEEATGLALDQAHARLFSVCRNKVMVVTDSISGRRVAALPIGEHPERRGTGRVNPNIAHRGVVLNLASHEAFLPQVPLRLSVRAFALLEVLLDPSGQVISKARLAQKLYGWHEAVESNTLDVYIHHLRKKLGAEFIRNVRGVGDLVDAAS